jgi:hypothetical protein
MFLGIAFACMLVTACAYAAYFGGAAGRYCAALFIGASIISIFPTRYYDFTNTSAVLLGIDFLCFVILTLLAFIYLRRWLIWCAGFQLACVTTHFGTIVAPHFSPMAYQALIQFWSLPILLVMVAGIMKDQRISFRP